MSDWRLTPANAALVVVDVQEKLMNAMPQRAETIAQIGKLLAAARIMDIPVLQTLQYVKGLGPVCGELAESTAGVPTFEKLAFSACGADGLLAALEKLQRPRVILCGVEAHVCVQQTAFDLMAHGQQVYLCVDAVCSRRALDAEIARERMRDGGAVITTTESLLFELLREAGTPLFKQCLPLFR